MVKKMKKYTLLIAEDNDISTNKIAHWLLYFNHYEMIRINERDFIDTTNIKLAIEGKSEFSLIVNEKLHIHSDKIHSYWYRRGKLNNKGIGAMDSIQLSGGTSKQKRAFFEKIEEFYSIEWESISDYLHYLLKNLDIVNINSFMDLKSNRLINAEVAMKIGLKVPETIVSNSIEAVSLFLDRHPEIITKCIFYSGLSRTVDGEFFGFGMGTNIFTKQDLEVCRSKGNYFQPTLFQQYIDKEFEIRSFYLQGEIYSMAIFSQINEKTRVDFRNYDDDFPNRNIPYKLPLEIENKMRLLMESLQYDSASFDFIYSKGEYWFLEINTVGQFDWVSKYCNYHIEKRIATKLS